MQIRINYHTEIENIIFQRVEYLREEFHHLFGQKSYYTDDDRKTAMEIINYLTKTIESPQELNYILHILENVEEQYPLLF